MGVCVWACVHGVGAGRLHHRTVPDHGVVVVAQLLELGQNQPHGVVELVEARVEVELLVGVRCSAGQHRRARRRLSGVAPAARLLVRRADEGDVAVVERDLRQKRRAPERLHEAVERVRVVQRVVVWARARQVGHPVGCLVVIPPVARASRRVRVRLHFFFLTGGSRPSAAREEQQIGILGAGK